ncbi:low molecular weight phosphotyrosine protein phosphatase [Purpureocillium lavendulum]|uniref:Low molecular weight phosphotyrosine protein phosphatase n=1 Tax=Purpureocillium lavendulum TaxID=1247861 RepID=A0AB34FCX3_9HYPO|nr:low molecular weight phosphotyrosine protein phosphatase [Purpureocillium lavendulum]
MHLLLFLATVAGALTTGTTTNGVYRQPKTSSTLTVNIEIGGAPANTTTFDGLISVFPIRGGAVKGSFFQGNLVANLSSSTERILPGSNGTKTEVETRWVLEDKQGRRILANMQGMTTYANEALHGFGVARLMTDAAQYSWVSWENFLVEWTGEYYSGTAEFEIFSIKSGGRKDGKPIKALLPPGKGK